MLAAGAGDITPLAHSVRRYLRELKRLGIEPAEVYLPIHPARAALFLARELELVVVGAPLAIFGTVCHLLPYVVVTSIARATSTDTDHWASNVIYPGLMVFPIYELVLLASAWLMLPAMWAAIFTVALPYTGYYALLYRERAGSAWRRAGTFFYFLFNRETQSRLAEEGRRIVAAVHALDERMQAGMRSSGELR